MIRTPPALWYDMYHSEGGVSAVVGNVVCDWSVDTAYYGNTTRRYKSRLYLYFDFFLGHYIRPDIVLNFAKGLNMLRLSSKNWRNKQ